MGLLKHLCIYYEENTVNKVLNKTEDYLFNGEIKPEKNDVVRLRMWAMHGKQHSEINEVSFPILDFQC